VRKPGLGSTLDVGSNFSCVAVPRGCIEGSTCDGGRARAVHSPRPRLKVLLAGGRWRLRRPASRPAALHLAQPVLPCGIPPERPFFRFGSGRAPRSAALCILCPRWGTRGLFVSEMESPDHERTMFHQASRPRAHIRLAALVVTASGCQPSEIVTGAGVVRVKNQSASNAANSWSSSKISGCRWFKKRFTLAFSSRRRT